MGESCSRHRVARLLRCEGLKAQRGYRKRPYPKAGAPAIVVPNLLEQQLTVQASNRVWVTDITYITTREGWLHLAVVIDLFSRQVVDWAMGSRIDTQLALDALHMAIWRRRPSETAIVHSDQGCQFTSHEWQRFLEDHNLCCSMSRRGNCHDNAVAESFFQLLKRERIRKKTYATRQEARSDVSTPLTCSQPIGRHSSAQGLSPVEFERRNSMRLNTV